MKKRLIYLNHVEMPLLECDNLVGHGCEGRFHLGHGVEINLIQQLRQHAASRRGRVNQPGLVGNRQLVVYA